MACQGGVVCAPVLLNINVHFSDLFSVFPTLKGDSGNNSIRLITISSRSVSTIAGGTVGYADGVGSLARFDRPLGVVIDPTGTFALVVRGAVSGVKHIALPSSHSPCLLCALHKCRQINLTAQSAASQYPPEMSLLLRVVKIPVGIPTESDHSQRLVTLLALRLIQRVHFHLL